MARALPCPDPGLQGSAGLGLSAAFAALWEPALQFWLPSFGNNNILKYPPTSLFFFFFFFFCGVYPAQPDVFLSPALPAEQFVQQLTWLMLHKLWKCLFGLN